jgi:hypothetical protein
VVAAHLAVIGFAGNPEYGMVIPEGRDDLELRGQGGRVLSQVKSRRDHMGPFRARAVAGFVKTMWESKNRQPDDRFLLILESNVGARSSLETRLQELAAYPSIVSELKGRKALSVDVAKTQILVLPNPRVSAVAEISDQIGCTLLEAEVYFADLVGVAGQLADDNGMREPGAYQGIGVSDVEQRFDVLRPLLTSVVVEAALTTGLCAAVDFLTPHDDPLFYLGVDVQPAHVAAGLVVERPELRSAVLDGLEGRRNVLVHGASGSGKSAVLWDAAYASHHSVRWFQVRRLPVEALPSLILLARSRRASVDAPVGFVIDDVGRGFAEAWTALAAEVRRTPGLLLLASVREEDRYTLVDKGQATQVKVGADVDLAERVWCELGERGQTTWKGWREPWKLANGHLLEYTHVLTQGQRLSDTLSTQVAARLNDIARHDELDVLRVVACANAAGCGAEVTRLPKVLGKDDSKVSFALRRLVDEHLVQGTTDGRVVGLHELRSSELLRLTHEFPPPLLSTTAAAAVQLVPTDELARFLERTLSRHEGGDDAVLDALADRIHSTPNAQLFAAAITGLDLALAHRVVRVWLSTVEAQNVPKAQRALPAQLAIGSIEPPNIGHEGMFVPAYHRFTEIRDAAATNSLSLRLMHRLGPSGIRAVLEAAGAIQELSQCIAALGGLTLPVSLRKEFVDVSPPLLDADFDDIVSLLDAASALDRSIANAWVSRVGQEALFQRFNESVPWTAVPSLAPCDEGREVRADVWCVAPPLQGEFHDFVVRSCKVLMALTPSADLVASSAMGPDGPLQMINSERPFITKRIPRGNLPCRAVVARNRAWIAVLDSHLATVSYTAYLSQCLELIRVISRALKIFLDARFRGLHDAAALVALGQAFESSRTLVAPQEEEAAMRRRSSQLQSIVSSCSIDLVRRFIELPTGAAAYIGWMNDLLGSIAKAKAEEIWEVLSMRPPKELDELSRIVEGYRALAGEAFVRDLSPIAMHLAKGVKKGSAFDRACTAAHQFRKAKLNALEARLRSELCPDENGLKLFLLPDASVPMFWPPADVLICIPTDTPDDLNGTVLAHWSKWRAAVDSSRKICLLPVMDGRALPHLALSGFDTLFPAADNADAWCAVAGLQPLPCVSVAAFARISNALVELDGIQAYWAVKGGRAVSEERAHAQAQTALVQAVLAFQNLGIPDEYKTLVQQFVDGVLSRDLELAADLAGLTRGEPGLSALLLSQIVQDLTLLDNGQLTIELAEPNIA